MKQSHNYLNNYCLNCVPMFYRPNRDHAHCNQDRAISDPDRLICNRDRDLESRSRDLESRSRDLGYRSRDLDFRSRDLDSRSRPRLQIRRSRSEIARSWLQCCDLDSRSRDIDSRSCDLDIVSVARVRRPLEHPSTTGPNGPAGNPRCGSANATQGWVWAYSSGFAPSSAVHRSACAPKACAAS